MSETQSKHRSILTALTRLDAHYRFMVSVGVALVCYASFLGHLNWGKHLILSFNTAVLALGINIASGLF
jgi:hypothetical protein